MEWSFASFKVLRNMFLVKQPKDGFQGHVINLTIELL